MASGRVKTPHNIIQLEAMLLALNDSEISFELKSVDITDNSLVVAYMNSQGGIHSGNLYLNL